MRVVAHPNIAAALFLLFLPLPAMGQEAGTLLLDERFPTLDRWQPLLFPKISRHSSYTLDQCDGASCLRMASNDSASALVLKQSFDVYRFPMLSWGWKVSNVYRKGDSASKEGDDYPARLYVMFAYDPDQASIGKQLQYGMAKALYGQYPPDSSISYIWDNRPGDAPFIVNAYTDAARMIPVSAGSEGVGNWREYSVDILRDYRRAFGRNPPATASLAVMIDSDDTHEQATAWVRFIRIEAAP